MKISLLCENQASDMVWLAEWGFSALIEHNGNNILFDTGYSDVWVKNAAHADIDLQKVDVLALSHFHRDHTRGLRFHPFEEKKRLVLHPRVLTASLDPDDPVKQADFAHIHRILAEDFLTEPTIDPIEFLSGAFFLGEIPRVTGFEKGCFEHDPMPDDTALAFQTEKGAVVVTGCSHAGICNICEQAKSVTGQPLYAVIGGFHLMAEENPPVDETIDWFRREKVPHLMPMHCVDFEFLSQFHNELGTQKLGSGNVIEL